MPAEVSGDRTGIAGGVTVMVMVELATVEVESLAW